MVRPAGVPYSTAVDGGGVGSEGGGGLNAEMVSMVESLTDSLLPIVGNGDLLLSEAWVESLSEWLVVDVVHVGEDVSMQSTGIVFATSD